ncbi:MAG TPA: hypothetical protein VIY48_20835, partial [Candidatus Paceibacterota bacterium]
GRSRWAIAADMIDPPTLRWRRDPVAWATERAGLELWSKQREILESIRDNSNTAVHSCHSSGKSYVSSVATAWWLDVHPVGEARVVTTAPTSTQVDAILWYEIGKIHRKLNLAGVCNLRSWYIGKQLVALGRKPPDHQEAAFQGMHAKYLLVIYDEAYGIPKNLWDEGTSLASNEYSRQLAIGNPDGPGIFEDKCKPGSTWHIIHIGARHTPNFTGESVSDDLAVNLISKRWASDRAIEWGEDSALYQSKVDGVFPTEVDPFSVVPYSWIAKCRLLELPTDDADEVEAGIDVGAGADRTVIRERRGMKVGRESTFIDKDPMRTIGRLVDKINEWGVQRVKVDVTGIGWALGGRLRELSSKHNHSKKDTSHSAEVVRVNFGEKPSPGNERKFLNRRAEIYWTVGRELSRLEQWDLTGIDDDVTRELTASRYEILDSYGKIKIEPKKKVIERLRMSPDRAEALLLSFYSPRRATVGVGGAGQVLRQSGSLVGGVSPSDRLSPL